MAVGATDDLAKLSYLDEARLLSELRARYHKSTIYVSGSHPCTAVCL
jgi:myosin heavy subunit